MEKLKDFLFDLWKRVLMMHRRMLIKAELRRRRAIAARTKERGSKERRESAVPYAHQNQIECLRRNNDYPIESRLCASDDPTAAAASRKIQCPCSEVEMKRVFDMIDGNKDGVISATELQLHMKRLGFDLSDQMARRIVENLGRNGDEHVHFEEFLSMYRPVSGETSSGSKNCKSPDTREEEEAEEEETLLKAFFVFDEDKDGFISRLELQQVLLKLGLPEGRSLIGCKKMIEKVDADGNGKVDFFEFKIMMRSNSFVFCQ